MEMLFQCLHLSGGFHLPSNAFETGGWRFVEDNIVMAIAATEEHAIAPGFTALQPHNILIKPGRPF